jgi:predicted AlkP superfamily pyrophosphatase or phosphodiesterase
VESPDPQSATGGRNAAAWLDAPYVILVSFDGFASRYLPALQPPTIAELASRGVHAPQGMIPAFPSKTFPNHYTLATGVWPANHGIVGNTFYDPQRDATYRISDRDAVEDGSWYQAEPLWVTAERQGMVAASFYWVGSEADVMGVRPSYWRTYDGEVPNRERVAQVLEWLRYPAEYRPHMITLYFSLVDAAGHSFGPQSPEVAEAVAEADTLVRELWEGIRALPHGDRVSLVVTSDHGMDGYGADNIEYVSDALRSLEGIRMPSAGPNGNLFVEGGPAEARRVRDAINAGLEHTTAHLGAEMPERFHYRGNPRIGDVVLVPDSGWVVYPEPDRPPRPGFTHGWDPAVRSMRALFFAVGHALPAGRTLPPFSITQVHPLVVRLLGLEPPEEIDGDLSFWDGVVGSAPVGSAPVGAANGG